MTLSDIDLSNTAAIAQLTTVLVVIAFLLAFYVFGRIPERTARRKK